MLVMIYMLVVLIYSKSWRN